LNRIILVGRLTRDPQLKHTSNGTAVANFTIAVNRRRSKEKEVDFIDVVVWQKLAELSAQYLSKGKQVGVEGRLEIRSYEDKEGIKRKIAEVIADNIEFLSPAGQSAGQAKNDIGGEEFDEETIPF
jgi:single-strand DNA-binding protein